MFWFRDGFFYDQVQQLEERFSGCSVVAKVNLPRMDSVVSNYAHDVKRLLHPRVEASFHQRANIFIDIFTGLAKLFA